MKKQIVWVVAVILLAGLTACDRGERQKGPEITTPYAAVMLDNGQLFYGKLVNAGSSFPELTDSLGPNPRLLIALHSPNAHQKPDCTCCPSEKSQGSGTFAVKQCVLSSPCCQAKIAKNGHVSRILREIEVGILCS